MINSLAHRFFRGTIILITVCLFSVLVSFDIQAQSRKRAKSKTKTTKTISSQKPQTSAEAKKLQAKAQKEIKQTEEQIRENEAEVKRGLAELGKLDQDIDESNKKIKELNNRVSALNNEITSLESGIRENEKDLEKLRGEYLKAVKKMRVTKKNKSTLAFIFSSKSVNQAMRRMRYLKEFSAWKNRQTEEITIKTEDLKNQRDALGQAQKEQITALALQRSAMSKLSEQHSRQVTLVNNLKQNGSTLQTLLKRKQAEASELDNMVSLLIAEEQRKAAEEEARRKAAEEEAKRKAQEEKERLLAQETSNKQQNPASQDTKKQQENKENKKNNKETPKTQNTDYASARKRAPRNTQNSIPASTNSTDFASQRGSLPFPTTGSFQITSAFGRQTMPDLPDVVYDNPGIDADSDAGASARAVFKGKVSGVYVLPGYNTVVIINHGNYYSVYGNISSPSVKTGDAVEAGAHLGRLSLKEEDTRHSSIHFEIWKNREKLNPQEWLR